MTLAARYYRLRIRNQADTADDLNVSSYSGGATPYLVKPPDGDGQSFDPLTGVSSVGVYTGEVIDFGAESGATPLVTDLLADANERYHLLSRRAYWEWSDDGTTWNQLVGGYVNAIRLVSPMVYAITVGDTRRHASRCVVWTRITPTFNRATNVIGAPIREGFGPMPAIETWRFKVAAVVANKVTIEFVEGWVWDVDSTVRLARAFQERQSILRINDLLRAEFTPTRSVGALAVDYGWFPGVNVDLYELDGTTLDSVRHPIAQTIVTLGMAPFGAYNSTDNVMGLDGTIVLYWPDAQPIVDDEFLVYGYRTTIGEDNPLHVAMHPIDIETGHWDDLGQAYDATAATAVRTALGGSLRVLLRITQGMKLEEAQKMLRGMFGYGARRNSDGEEVLFLARLRDRDVPSTEITTANVPGWAGVIFDLDESTICNVVTMRQHRFIPWTEEIGSERPADGLVMVPQTRRVELNSEGGATPDFETLGEVEQVYELPGVICQFTFVPLALRFAYIPVDFDAFGEAQASEIFERYGRGGVEGELDLIGASITESVGEEVQLTLPHQVNANARGGTRIVQIVQRTEIPSGAQLRVLDSGSTNQLATLPTFTIAAGTDTRKIAEVTFTNAATLNAADVVVTVEVGFTDGGATPEVGVRSYVYGIGWTDVPASVELVPVDAGAIVWVRMRASQPNRRPGAWTDWQSVDLDDLDAPTGLTLSADDPEDGAITATWSLGANADDIPLEVFLGIGGATPGPLYLWNRLPAGSVATVLYPGPGDWTVGVRHAESPPYGGISATTEDDVTVLNTQTLDPPTDPVGIGSAGTGVYGLGVTAVEFPSEVEFSVAVEDSYDVGTYGAYGVVATLPSVEGLPTTWTGWVKDDRLRRKIRARHTRDGATGSSYTAEEVVWAWYAYPVTT